MLPTLTPHEFVTKWRKADLKERAAAQEHSIDLRHLAGHLSRARLDLFRHTCAPRATAQEASKVCRVVAMTQATRELVEKRDACLNPEGATEKELKKRTLTNLYNQRPTWLDLAHRKLDDAVLDAYGWRRDAGDEEILEGLLALNLARAEKPG